MRRTIVLITFDIAIKNEDEDTTCTITLNYSKVVLGETSKENIEAIIKIINKGKDYLSHWA